MDKRKGLEKGRVLEFPGMLCTVEEEIGRGSNAIVYKGSYPDLLNSGQRHTVLIKELFPYHRDGGIYRGEDGSVKMSEEGAETLALHRESFEYGNKIHLKMLERYPDSVGANINTYSLGGTFYTVLGYSGGRSLEEELSGGTADLRTLTVRIISLIDSLESFHGMDFLHLDIAPDNILLVGEGRGERVILIDYNSVYDLHGDVGEGDGYYSIKPGYTAPELRCGRKTSPTYATDIYSVAAVFWRCITGSPLSSLQTVMRTLPDVSDCPVLKDVPHTAAEQVRQILSRGLANLPQRRYESTASLREALEELLCRIDGVGITHSALWEAGLRSVVSMTRKNTAYAYLAEGDVLYPSRVVGAEGQLCTMREFVSSVTSATGKSSLLTASGGMGKTTAMLSYLLGMEKRYSASSAAVLYVPLLGQHRDGNSIKNSILENLRFDSDTRTFEVARQKLVHEFSRPLEVRGERRPRYLLFLDGFNEAVGNTAELVAEIVALSRLEGVCLIISSRNKEADLPFPCATISPLEAEDVEEVLSKKGLLMPEAPEIAELLRTPLMLSIFISSADAAEGQLVISKKDELMERYFDSLRLKEIDGDSEGDDSWQLEVAVELVLPCAAGEIMRLGGTADDAQLLPAVQRCFRLFSSPIMKRAFPRWIGHSKAITAGCSSGEQWYGLMVQELLWRRLGMLVRRDNGRYTVLHGIIADHLLLRERENRKRIRGRRLLKGGLLSLSIAAALGVALIFAPLPEKKEPHNEGYAEYVLAVGQSDLGRLCGMYEHLSDVASCASEGGDVAPVLDRYYDYVERESQNSFGDDFELFAENMLSGGEVMPWSGAEFDYESAALLRKLFSSNREDYALFTDVLLYVLTDSVAAERYGGYVEDFALLVETDGDIAAALYGIAYDPHLSARYDGDSSAEADSYRDTVKLSLALVEKMNALSLDDADLVTNLLYKRERIINEIRSSGVIAAYEKK